MLDFAVTCYPVSGRDEYPGVFPHVKGGGSDPPVKLGKEGKILGELPAVGYALAVACRPRRLNQ
jgi:hypothetical protein